MCLVGAFLFQWGEGVMYIYSPPKSSEVNISNDLVIFTYAPVIIKVKYVIVCI